MKVLTFARDHPPPDSGRYEPIDSGSCTDPRHRPIRRFGDWVLDLSPPEAAPVTALNLAPGALFPGGRFDPYPG